MWAAKQQEKTQTEVTHRGCVCYAVGLLLMGRVHSHRKKKSFVHCYSCCRRGDGKSSQFRAAYSSTVMRGLWLVSGCLGIWQMGTTHGQSMRIALGNVAVGDFRVCLCVWTAESEVVCRVFSHNWYWVVLITWHPACQTKFHLKKKPSFTARPFHANWNR